MGKKGRKALATMTLNILPKLELAVILTYLMMFPKVFLPSTTPSSRTIKSFSSKIMSALSFAMSTAESTEMPTSDSLNAAASLMPSPRNPTVLFCFCKIWIISTFCMGVSLAKSVPFCTAALFSSSVISLNSPPVYIMVESIPTCLEIVLTTASLSPDNTFISIPCE